MKTKVFSTWTTDGLEKEINDFLLVLENENIEIIEVQFSSTIFSYSAIIIYK